MPFIPDKQRGRLAEAGAAVVGTFLGEAKGLTGTAADISKPKPITTAGGPYSAASRAALRKKDPVYEGLVEATRKIRSAEQKFQPTRGGAEGWLINTLAGGGTQLGINLALGAEMGWVGPATNMFAVARQNTLDAGGSELEADLTGLSEAALESWGVSKLLKFKAAGKGSLKALISNVRKGLYKEAKGNLKNIGTNVLKSALVEGLEEVSQGGAEFLVETIPGGRDVPKKPDGSVDWGFIVKSLAEQGTGGALLGALVPGGMGAIEVATEGGAQQQRLQQPPAPKITEQQPQQVNVYRTVSDSRTGITEQDVVREGERYVDKVTGEDVVLDTEASGTGIAHGTGIAQEQPVSGAVEQQPKAKPIRMARSKALKLGHDIPKMLGWNETQRRDFMQQITGKSSMKNMTPKERAKLISALREKAGITEASKSGREFKKPVFPYFTPQLYEAEKLGIANIIGPAVRGKQTLDIEFNTISKAVDRVGKLINKLGGETLISKAKAKAANKPTKSIQRFAELLNEYEEAPDSLSAEEKAAFKFFRGLNKSILERENASREKLGLDPIPYKAGYMRHIADTLAIDIMEGRYPIPEEIKAYVQKKAPSKIHNPMEFQRQLSDELEDIFSKDLAKATKAMLWTGLKEIHLNEPLQFFRDQMNLDTEDMPARTKKWAEDFINHNIIGMPTDIDAAVDEWVKEGGIGKVVDKVLRPFGRRMSKRPVTSLLSKVGRLQIYGVMGWRPKQLIRNKFQFIQNLSFSTIKNCMKGMLPASKNLKAFLKNNLFFQTYKGFEDLTEVDKRILGKAWLAPFQWTAVSNAKTAMKIAYYDTMELITNPKYKDLKGWRDPQRTGKEPKDFLYPSEQKVLEDECVARASAAQYHYIPMAMPQIFKYKIATPLTRLQSWWMNYFFKFHTEAAHRFSTGKTRTGQTLPWSRRIGWGRYMVLGGVVLNTLGYSSSYIFGAAPQSTPPIFQVLLNLYRLCTVWEDKTRKSAKRRLLNSLKTFIPGYLSYKDMKALYESEGDLTQLLFYKKGIFKEKEQGYTGGYLNE